MRKDLWQLLAFFDKRGHKTGRLIPFFTMVKLRARIQRDTISTMRGKHREFLETTISLSTDVESMGVNREPANQYASRRATGRLTNF